LLLPSLFVLRQTTRSFAANAFTGNLKFRTQSGRSEVVGWLAANKNDPKH
jgi:hypothetical protein